jgi:hypothetical protein
MSISYFQPFSEHVLEWVILLSAVAAGLCALALAVMMVVGRWRPALHQRKENGQRTALSEDALGLKARQRAASHAADLKR